MSRRSRPARLDDNRPCGRRARLNSLARDQQQRRRRRATGDADPPRRGRPGRGRNFVLAEDTSESEVAPDAYARLVEERRIDGVLIQSARLGNPNVESFASGLVPCVFVDRCRPGSGRNVSTRNDEAGRMVADHFLELGHRPRPHLGGPSTSTRWCDRRRPGPGGLHPSGPSAGPSEEKGDHAMHALFAHEPPPTAVYIANINYAPLDPATEMEAALRRSIPSGASARRGGRRRLCLRVRGRGGLLGRREYLDPRRLQQGAT